MSSQSIAWTARRRRFRSRRGRRSRRSWCQAGPVRLMACRCAMLCDVAATQDKRYGTARSHYGSGSPPARPITSPGGRSRAVGRPQGV